MGKVKSQMREEAIQEFYLELSYQEWLYENIEKDKEEIKCVPK